MKFPAAPAVLALAAVAVAAPAWRAPALAALLVVLSLCAVARLTTDPIEVRRRSRL